MYSKEKSTSSRSRVLALALVLCLVLGCLGAGFAYADNDAREPMSASDVYEQNVRSTVGISTSYVTTNYWGYTTNLAAAGSGFIVTEDGYVVTNYHVVENSDKVKVTTYDDETYEATVVGYDAENDVAVLKIEAKGLTPVKLGDSDALRVGDTVAAIGNPLGELTFSLTVGVVSALNRQVTFSNGAMYGLIQTDAAINSGNSGGPLFNMYGEVVGITNGKYSSRSLSSASIDNICFAISINQVKNSVQSIIENGGLVKPFIGVTVATVSEELQLYGIPQGAAVKEIAEGSPAEESELTVNDVITAANGEEITSSGDLVRVVSACKPGDTLELSVYRHNDGVDEVLTIELTVGKRNVEQEQSGKAVENGPQIQFGGEGSFPFGEGFGFGFPG